MTTKVIIQFPDNNHAQEIEVYCQSPDSSIEYLLTTLKQGESTEQYVHAMQNLLIVERL
jgi:hypothetical protein